MFGSGVYSQNEYFEKVHKISRKAEEICLDTYKVKYSDLCLCDTRRETIWAEAEQAYYKAEQGYYNENS